MVAWVQKYQVFILIGLAAVVVWGAWLFLSRQDNRVEIVLSQEQSGTSAPREVYVDGNIGNPGIYPLKPDDTIQDILLAAGVKDGSDLSKLSLHVSKLGETSPPLLVNINTAKAEFLTVLPGIGDTTAKAIVAYRDKNGPFVSTKDLMNVPGIGAKTYQDIMEYVTVGY